MSTELRVSSNVSREQHNRAHSSAWRRQYITEPSLWLLRDPETEEKMLRDADIAHAVGYRRHLIAGRDWSLVPRRDGEDSSKLAADLGTEILGNLKHFTQGRLNLARAFFSGARFARIHGEYRRATLGDGKPRVWWMPKRLEDLDKRMYRIVPDRDEQTQRVTAHWERWHIGPDEWRPETQEDAIHTIRHVYQDDQATIGHGRALREALGWWWYAKEHVFQESLQAVERFAQGVITAKVDGARDAATGLPNNQLIADWQEALENLRARHVMVFDKNDEVEMLTGNGDGWQMLGEIRQELRSSIFTLVLGANLTTSANEGGSYALAEIQENSTEALIQYDRETLQETLTDDLLGCVWYKNHANLTELGLHEDKPRFSITQEKKQDPQERAAVAEVLNRMGVDLPLEDLLDQTGFSRPEPGAPIVPGATAPDPSAFGAGIPGFGMVS